jgi:hypothetical protein
MDILEGRLDIWRLFRVCCLFLPLVIILSASTIATGLIIEIDNKGGAIIKQTETEELEYDEAKIYLSSAGKMATLTGKASFLGLDDSWNFEFSAYGNNAGANFYYREYGDYVDFMLGLYGYFDIYASMEEQDDGSLLMEATGAIPTSFLDKLGVINMSTWNSSETSSIIDNLETSINNAFFQMPIVSTPKLEIINFEISGFLILDFSLTAIVRDWREFIAASEYQGYLSYNDGEDFMSCLGISQEGFFADVLDASEDISIKLVGDERGISATLSVNGSAPLNLLESFDISIDTINSQSTFSGEVIFTKSDVMECIMKNYLLGDYILEQVDYSLIKESEENNSNYYLEAKVLGIASKTGDKWQVSFPAEVTSDMDITVKAPSGMSILSVSGGRKTSERTAVSTSGEDFTVTYGEAGEDYTMWILIAVGVLLLIFLAKRKK